MNWSKVITMLKICNLSVKIPPPCSSIFVMLSEFACLQGPREVCQKSLHLFSEACIALPLCSITDCTDVTGQAQGASSPLPRKDRSPQPHIRCRASGSLCRQPSAQRGLCSHASNTDGYGTLLGSALLLVGMASRIFPICLLQREVVRQKQRLCCSCFSV